MKNIFLDRNWQKKRMLRLSSIEYESLFSMPITDFVKECQSTSVLQQFRRKIGLSKNQVKN
ncbi:MAG: hypothetical protein LBG80_13945 [Bacteroidales bacterium]|nr:hypothetical protein [Bacteroidales bacterium]